MEGKERGRGEEWRGEEMGERRGGERSGEEWGGVEKQREGRRGEERKETTKKSKNHRFYDIQRNNKVSEDRRREVDLSTKQVNEAQGGRLRMEGRRGRWWEDVVDSD